MFISTFLNKGYYDNEKGYTNMSYRLLMHNYNGNLSVVLGYLNNILSSNRIKDTGSYLLIINSENEGGASGIFGLSKSDKSKFGNVTTICSSEGILNDKLIIEWNPYEYPKILLNIRKLKTDKREIIFSYNIKIID